MRLRLLIGLMALAAVAVAATTSDAGSSPGPNARVAEPNAERARRPRPLRLLETCVTRAERRRVVRFQAADRVRLIGVLLGSGPRGLVLAHQGGGFGADLCVWMPYARSLVRAGYRVLAFDHRGYGSSRGPPIGRLDLDVLAAVRVLRSRGVNRIVLGGASMGGAAVLVAGSTATPPVQGVVALAAPREFSRLDVLEASRRLLAPVSFLAAEEDIPFADYARELYEASPAADKRVRIFPGTQHGALLLRNSEAKSYVDAWIREHLP